MTINPALLQEVYKDTDLTPGRCLLCQCTATRWSLYEYIGHMTLVGGGTQPMSFIQFVGLCDVHGVGDPTSIVPQIKKVMQKHGVIDACTEIFYIQASDPRWG